MKTAVLWLSPCVLSLLVGGCVATTALGLAGTAVGTAVGTTVKVTGAVAGAAVAVATPHHHDNDKAHAQSNN